MSIDGHAVCRDRCTVALARAGAVAPPGGGRRPLRSTRSRTATTPTRPTTSARRSPGSAPCAPRSTTANQGPRERRDHAAEGHHQAEAAEGPAAQDNNEGELDVTGGGRDRRPRPGKTVIEQTVKDRVLRNDAPFAGFTAPGLQLNDVTLTGGRDRRRRRERRRRAPEQRVRPARQRRHPGERQPAPTRTTTSRGAGSGRAASSGMARDDRPGQRGVGGGVTREPRAAGIFVQDGGVTDSGRLEGGREHGGDPRPGGHARSPGRRGHPRPQPRDRSRPTRSPIIDSTIAGQHRSGRPARRARAGSSPVPGPTSRSPAARSPGNRSKTRRRPYAVGVGLGRRSTNSTISGNSDTGQGGAAIFHQAGTDAIDDRRAPRSRTTSPSAGHFAIEAGEQAAPGSLEPVRARSSSTPARSADRRRRPAPSQATAAERRRRQDLRFQRGALRPQGRPRAGPARGQRRADEDPRAQAVEPCDRPRAVQPRASTSADCPARSGPTATRAPTSGSSER